MVKGVKGCVVDFTSTKHIGAVTEQISYYTPIKEGIECEYVGNNRSMLVCGKGKVLLKLDSRSSHLTKPHFGTFAR